MARAAKKKKKASWRKLATLRLGDLRRLSQVLRASDEVLDADNWLTVIANTLASAPEGPVTSRRGPDAPEVWQLAYENIAVEAMRCGLQATETEIETILKETLAIRDDAERGRAGRLLPLAGDEIAARLGVTANVRREARAWSVGATDETPADRAEARRENARIREEARRRDADAKPRAEYEANSLSRTKPWEAEGVSRTVWFELGGKVGAASRTGPCAANSSGQVRAGQVRAQPIACRRTSPCAANRPDIATAAFAAHGQAGKARSDTKIEKGPSKKRVDGFSVSNKARHRGRRTAEYRHPPGGLGIIAAALVERPTATEAPRSKLGPSPSMAATIAAQANLEAHPVRETNPARVTPAADPPPEVHPPLESQKAFVELITPELTPAEYAAARATMEALRDEMAAENKRCREWMSASPYDRDGNLTIRSILTGETTTIELGANR